MKELIQKINKKSLADETGISYSRLRKYSSGILKSLSVEELNLILNYFQQLTETVMEAIKNEREQL